MAKAIVPAVIDPHSLYRRDAAKQVTGWGDHKMRDARDRGLPLKYEGRYAYILGQDLIDFIVRNSTNAKPGSH